MRSTEHAMNVGRDAISEAEASCRKIYTEVENSKQTLSGGWTGDASTGFGASVSEWLVQLKALGQSMDEMGVQLGGTRHEFTANEEEAVIKAQWTQRVNR
ncbi:WXG100 family type VII secretion target [Streptomyces sp. x-80]|uniref:WXG100 family type VII secretion target n=1 Tax=Streptomyces sp. x-80 TaxID=2789282 RepID=UPI00397F6304